MFVFFYMILKWQHICRSLQYCGVISLIFHAPRISSVPCSLIPKCPCLILLDSIKLSTKCVLTNYKLVSGGYFFLFNRTRQWEQLVIHLKDSRIILSLYLWEKWSILHMCKPFIYEISFNFFPHFSFWDDFFTNFKGKLVLCYLWDDPCHLSSFSLDCFYVSFVLGDFKCLCTEIQVFCWFAVLRKW